MPRLVDVSLAIWSLLSIAGTSASSSLPGSLAECGSPARSKTRIDWFVRNCSAKRSTGATLLQSRKGYSEFTDDVSDDASFADISDPALANETRDNSTDTEQQSKITVMRTSDIEGGSKTIITSVDTANETIVDMANGSAQAVGNKTLGIVARNIRDRLNTLWKSRPLWTTRHIITSNTTNGSEGEDKVATRDSSRESNQPFVKVKKVTNVTEETQRVEADVKTPRHANATVNVTVKTKVTHTTVTINIASASDILSVYIIMFTPIALAWAVYYHWGMKEEHYAVLGPVTLCANIIGSELVNQSLAVIMDSPNGITAIQSCIMAISIGIWFLIFDYRAVSAVDIKPLSMWLVVSLFFALHQVLGHQVSYHCSLSEGIVFLNLCPPCALLVEMFMMPKALQPIVSFKGKIALCLVVIGAILFSIQHPRFTTTGMLVASGLVAVSVPYRLLQRRFLGAVSPIPVSILGSLDGMVLIVPSIVLAKSQHENFVAKCISWFSEPSVIVMLILSMLTFIGGHIGSLNLLRRNSATTCLVVNNMANFITAFLGVYFFADNVTGTPLVFMGLAVSLLSGLWYAWEAQPASVRKGWVYFVDGGASSSSLTYEGAQSKASINHQG